MAAPEKLAHLRLLLAERFPSGFRPAGNTLATGIPNLDESVGGLPMSAVTELVCTSPSCGSHLFLHQILTMTRAQQTRVALIDGHDSFDPGSTEPDLLAHVLWIRCQKAAQALEAVDLVARDSNLGLAVLDLRLTSEIELRRIAPTYWYRVQRSIEVTNLCLLVQTPHAMIPSATLRLLLEQPHGTEFMTTNRHDLVAALVPALQRQRTQLAASA